MDTLCGVGLPELLILALLGFVVIGPERSQEVAVQLGRWLGTAMRSPWWREFQEVTDALRNLPTTLVRMAELEEAQKDIQRTLDDIDDEVRSGFESTGQEITDPWDIQNAVASTRRTPAQPSSDAAEADIERSDDLADLPPGGPPDSADDQPGEERSE